MDQVAFLQLSDFHIGRHLLANYQFGLPLVDGYNPHDDRVFDSLYLSIQDARRLLKLGREERLPVVFSGDMTAGGTRNDFALASHLFFDRWRYPAALGKWDEEMGLGLDPADAMMVAGNHDHWGADYVQRGYRAEVGRDFMPRTPWVRTLKSPGGRLQVELYGVDSNSGWEAGLVNWNILAWGCFSRRHVVSLEAHLESQAGTPAAGQTVRAFVCHHALTSGTKHLPLPLDDSSRNVLLHLAAEFSVAAVLTGHTHEFDIVHWLHPFSAQREWVLRELRGASASAGAAKPGRHGFYLHQITLEDGAGARPVWKVWKYQTGTATDFDRDSVPAYEFTP
jgi:hypothetical protein